ncbi:MAG: type 2 lantipeptide synthetase LanM [Desulfobacterales bacterium]|nr:type 2 lantipeptide synthetase LanM [Desulfobacterales bacterium]MBF0396008.1 type 2 lantipeptide synthetase LanM [Desulfobacterales bacterium]
MKLTEREKSDIAAKATFIHERLSGLVEMTGEPLETSETLFNRWRKAVIGMGKDELFDRRLAMESSDQEMAVKVMGKVRWPAEKELPDWVKESSSVIDMLPLSAESLKHKLPVEVFDPEMPLPFEEAWLPWIVYASQRLKMADREFTDIFTPRAAALCLRQLIKELNRYFGKTLMTEFYIKRYQDNPLPFILSSLLKPQPVQLDTSKAKTDSPAQVNTLTENHLYCQFYQKLLEGGWKDQLINRPVWARLLILVIKNWSDILADLVKRLNSDKEQIENVLNHGATVGKADKIDMYLSDRHNNGRTVMCITFENGLKVIYKPRSLKIDSAWKIFLVELKQKGLNTNILTPVLIDQEEYGWVEHIENRGLSTPYDASMYYLSCGMLLAIAYALGSNDLHKDNLIACGSQPVVIDLETIMRPEVRSFDYNEKKDPDVLQEISDRFWNKSVLNIMLLPVWTPLNQHLMRDYGGLTPFDNVYYTIPDWQDINSDKMRLAPCQAPAKPSPNCPHYQGKISNVKDYVDKVEEGFKTAYDFFLDHRDEAVCKGGWLDIFKGCEFRLLARTTQIYGDMIEYITSPELLKDGAIFSSTIEGLAPAFLRYAPLNRLPYLWNVFKQERDAISQLDIPIFYNRTDDIGIYTKTGNIVSDYFLNTANENSREQFKYMNHVDRDDQLKLIRSSLSIRYSDQTEINTVNNQEWVAKQNEKGPLTKAEIMDAVLAIAEEIDRRAIFKDGQIQWITRQTHPITHQLILGPLPPLLYNGKSGIGLFFSACFYKSRMEKFKEKGKACFKDLLGMLKNERLRATLRHFSIGHASGICGCIHAMILSGRFLESSELTEAALDMAKLIIPEKIENDEGLDILSGSAGCILTMLALMRETSIKSYLDIAVKCGDHLLKKRINFQNHKLWPSSFASQPLTGFGHGASGCACALLLLYKETGQKNFLEAAMDAISYENEVFSPKHLDWPDFRMNPEKKNGVQFMTGICSGAPGIGLSRLWCLNVLDNDQIRKDIDHAIEFSLRLPVMYDTPDHLCCGNCSRIEFLMEAGNRLDNQVLLDAATAISSKIIRRAKEKGHYTFNGDTSGAVFSPGLFSGTAGVGYTLLRLLDYKGVSSILIPTFGELQFGQLSRASSPLCA